MMKPYELLGPLGAGVGAHLTGEDVGPAMMRGLMPGMNMLFSLFNKNEPQPGTRPEAGFSRPGSGKKRGFKNSLMDGLHQMGQQQFPPQDYSRGMGGRYSWDKRPEFPPPYPQQRRPF